MALTMRTEQEFYREKIIFLETSFAAKNKQRDSIIGQIANLQEMLAATEKDIDEIVTMFNIFSNISKERYAEEEEYIKALEEEKSKLSLTAQMALNEGPKMTLPPATVAVDKPEVIKEEIRIEEEVVPVTEQPEVTQYATDENKFQSFVPVGASTPEPTPTTEPDINEGLPPGIEAFNAEDLFKADGENSSLTLEDVAPSEFPSETTPKKKASNRLKAAAAKANDK